MSSPWNLCGGFSQSDGSRTFLGSGAFFGWQAKASLHRLCYCSWKEPGPRQGPRGVARVQRGGGQRSRHSSLQRGFLRSEFRGMAIRPECFHRSCPTHTEQSHLLCGPGGLSGATVHGALERLAPRGADPEDRSKSSAPCDEGPAAPRGQRGPVERPERGPRLWACRVPSLYRVCDRTWAWGLHLARPSHVTSGCFTREGNQTGSVAGVSRGQDEGLCTGETLCADFPVLALPPVSPTAPGGCHPSGPGKRHRRPEDRGGGGYRVLVRVQEPGRQEVQFLA